MARRSIIGRRPTPVLKSPTSIRTWTQRARARLSNPAKKRGLLVAFEGPDGSGKTTQRKLLKTWPETMSRLRTKQALPVS